jgi:hypothetical protein
MNSEDMETIRAEIKQGVKAEMDRGCRQAKTELGLLRDRMECNETTMMFLYYVCGLFASIVEHKIQNTGR